MRPLRIIFSRPALGAMLCWLACGGTAQAQDPLVRTSLSAEQTVWVGQRVTLVVELLVPGYFDSAVSFDLPDPEGTLLMPPQGSPVVGSETIEDTHYTVQRHELSAWPMRPGEQSIPPVTARFSFKRHPLDTAGEPAALTSEATALKVGLPPGAENLGTVISARGLQVQESWNPVPGDEAVPAGTAYVRTITFSAPNVPGMLFPPFPAGAIEGLGVYPKRQLLDRNDRGALVGVRRDEITYICQRPGQYKVPAARFTWFDLDAKTLRSEELPARTLDVIANPAMASADAEAGAATAPGSRAWTRWAAVLALGAALLAAALSERGRRLVVRWLAPFRPVRLQPLNPPPTGTGYGAKGAGPFF